MTRLRDRGSPLRVQTRLIFLVCVGLLAGGSSRGETATDSGGKVISSGGAATAPGQDGPPTAVESAASSQEQPVVHNESAASGQEESTSGGQEQLPAQTTDTTLFPIHFPSGDAQLSVDSRAILAHIAQALRGAHLEELIRLEGRSDGREKAPEGETAEGRLALSRARAEAVLRALAAEGLPAARFEIVALGDTAPLGSLKEMQDLERNRSVRFVIMPGRVPGVVEEGSVAGQSDDVAFSRPAGAEKNPGGALETTQPALPGDPGTVDGEQVAPSDSPASPPADVVAITIQEAPRGPTEVETVRLGLKILRREGPGAGGRARWPIHEFLQQQLDEIEKVCRAGLRDERRLVGETQLQIWLTGNGEVESVVVQPPVPQSLYEENMATLFRSLTFPPPTGNGRMRVDMVLTVSASFRPVLVPSR